MNVGQYGLTEELLEEIFSKNAVQSSDILILSEVKLSLGDSTFDRCVQGWSREEHLRKDQQHGGLVIYVKNTRGLIHYRWDGLKFEGDIQIDAERGWTMVETNGDKVAVLGAYGRICDPTRKYHNNNVQLYEHLTREVLHLLQTGYKIVELGDFNSWLGMDDEYGIQGDVHQTEQLVSVWLTGCQSVSGDQLHIWTGWVDNLV